MTSSNKLGPKVPTNQAIAESLATLADKVTQASTDRVEPSLVPLVDTQQVARQRTSDCMGDGMHARILTSIAQVHGVDAQKQWVPEQALMSVLYDVDEKIADALPSDPSFHQLTAAAKSLDDGSLAGKIASEVVGSVVSATTRDDFMKIHEMRATRPGQIQLADLEKEIDEFARRFTFGNGAGLGRVDIIKALSWKSAEQTVKSGGSIRGIEQTLLQVAAEIPRKGLARLIPTRPLTEKEVLSYLGSDSLQGYVEAAKTRLGGKLGSPNGLTAAEQP
jgi:hypothetical protein